MLSDFDMLQNLQTLSTLQLNQKLCTTSKVFTVRDTSSYLSSVWRAWYGEDRHANVARLQSLFSLAMLRCEVLQLRGNDPDFYERVTHVITKAVPGLERLTQTYRDDVAVVSSLVVLLDDVRAFLARHGRGFFDGPVPIAKED